MKTRKGFVSNSSTTSFCLYGIYLEEDQQKEWMETYNKIKKWDELESYSAPYTDSIYLGKSLAKLKDDETGKQFKDHVKELIRNYFPDTKDSDFCIMENGWYDG
jgi:hypothetical protein